MGSHMDNRPRVMTDLSALFQMQEGEFAFFAHWILLPKVTHPPYVYVQTSVTSRIWKGKCQNAAVPTEFNQETASSPASEGREEGLPSTRGLREGCSVQMQNVP